MNKFELFTLIYYVLDAFYSDPSKTDDFVNTVISDMCPFTFNGIGSADPSVYKDYCAFIDDKNITLNNSLDIAKEYVKTIEYADVTEAFDSMTDNEWIVVCKKYLASEHKGANGDI